MNVNMHMLYYLSNKNYNQTKSMINVVNFLPKYVKIIIPF